MVLDSIGVGLIGSTTVEHMYAPDDISSVYGRMGARLSPTPAAIVNGVAADRWSRPSPAPRGRWSSGKALVNIRFSCPCSDSRSHRWFINVSNRSSNRRSVWVVEGFSQICSTGHLWLPTGHLWLPTGHQWFSTRHQWFSTRHQWFSTRDQWFSTRDQWLSTRHRWFSTRHRWFSTRHQWFSHQCIRSRHQCIRSCHQSIRSRHQRIRIRHQRICIRHQCICIRRQWISIHHHFLTLWRLLRLLLPFSSCLLFSQVPIHTDFQAEAKITTVWATMIFRNLFAHQCFSLSLISQCQAMLRSASVPAKILRVFRLRLLASEGMQESDMGFQIFPAIFISRPTTWGDRLGVSGGESSDSDECLNLSGVKLEMSSRSEDSLSGVSEEEPVQELSSLNSPDSSVELKSIRLAVKSLRQVEPCQAQPSPATLDSLTTAKLDQTGPVSTQSLVYLFSHDIQGFVHLRQNDMPRLNEVRCGCRDALPAERIDQLFDQLCAHNRKSHIWLESQEFTTLK
ncbi:hypothetical protein EYF80_025925 [Liparis tanakae]|uniref:Uncharacterized protein n=1 Tax=Liparis tanakae TaxID=230148 RepID=A0A4Z2HDS6_9TELE|nr:hypothetical protein EYF80_025925 [Liparis tanakae]